MNSPRIKSVEWGVLEGERPREAGCNARLAVHGLTVRVPLLRLTTDDGLSGFGLCQTDDKQAARLLGQPLDRLFSAETGVLDPWLPFEFPIWDLIGRREGKPVYALTAPINGANISEPFHVPCYDTSLYIDDLHLSSDDEAAALIAEEARQGYERGHRAFKIKVGRGARHMPLEAGTIRDIAVIRAVREAAGPTATLMIDANNGYNLNLTKRILTETAAANIFWMEEAFHEDPILYADLRAWLQAEGIATLIADGEGEASARLLTWANEGLIDVIQYDIFSYGLTKWLQTGRQLDGWSVRTAPHHYGRHYGNYATCHLAGAVKNFTFVEWDEVSTPGLSAPGYHINEGRVAVPNTPGFGLTLDEDIFQATVQQHGFSLS